MDLFGISPTQEASKGFSLAGANRPEAKEPAADAPVAEAPRTTVRTNMMAQNFVHAGREESRYVKGLKAGLASQNEFLNKMQSVVAGYRYLVELSGDLSYAKDAVKAVGTMVDDEVEETNTEKIEEMREEIEEKAEEAVAPESEKVMENETSPQEDLEDSLEEAAPEAQKKAESEQAVTEPEPNAEPVTEPEANAEPVSAAPEAGSGQETATPQETSGDGPATTSIDLMV